MEEKLFNALVEARDFIDTLLANTITEASDLLSNEGEDVLARLNTVITAARK